MLNKILSVVFLCASVLFGSTFAANATCTGGSPTVVTANSFITPQFPLTGFFRFTSSSSQLTYQTVLTGGNCGVEINGLWISSSDTALTHVVYCAVTDSSIQYGGGNLTTALSAQGGAFHGSTSNMLAGANWPGLPLDGNGNPVLRIAAGDFLSCAFVTGITSADEITVYAQGGSF